MSIRKYSPWFGSSIFRPFWLHPYWNIYWRANGCRNYWKSRWKSSLTNCYLNCQIATNNNNFYYKKCSASINSCIPLSFTFTQNDVLPSSLLAFGFIFQTNPLFIFAFVALTLLWGGGWWVINVTFAPSISFYSPLFIVPNMHSTFIFHPTHFGPFPFCRNSLHFILHPRSIITNILCLFW